VDHVAHIYYTLYDRFDVDSLLVRITNLPRTDRWQALARAAMRDDLYQTVTDMTTSIMHSTLPSLPAEDRLHQWESANTESIERASNMLEEVNKLDQDDMASLSVALRLMRSIVRR
jgi:glutamate dehydrogenase